MKIREGVKQSQNLHAWITWIMKAFFPLHMILQTELLYLVDGFEIQNTSFIWNAFSTVNNTV